MFCAAAVTCLLTTSQSPEVRAVRDTIRGHRTESGLKEEVTILAKKVGRHWWLVDQYLAGRVVRMLETTR